MVKTFRMKTPCLVLLVCLLLQGCTEQKPTGQPEAQKVHALLGFEKVIEAVYGCKKPFVELDVGGRSWEKRVRAGERERRCRGDVGER